MVGSLFGTTEYYILMIMFVGGIRTRTTQHPPQHVRRSRVYASTLVRHVDQNLSFDS